MANDPTQPPTPYQTPTADVFERPEELRGRRKHSGLGIASFMIAILGGLTAFAGMGAIFFLEGNSANGVEEMHVMMLGFCILGVGGLSFVGVALGIAAIVQTERMRTFGVIGLVFNLLIVLSIAGLMVLGLTMA